MTRPIGYNRTVKLRWLDETVDLLLTGQSEAQIREILRDRLQDQLSIGSDAERGSREKTITLLLKTWVRVPPRIRGIRDDAIDLLKGCQRSQRLPFHWGMTMAAYPFWRMVADVTGRLFRLQGSVSARQVQRRVKELVGEREVVSRSARYVLRAYADWGVILDSERKGTSTPAPLFKINDPATATWLLEALLFASDTTASDLKVLAQSPALFPFSLPHLTSDTLHRSSRLEVMRNAFDDDLVQVRYAKPSNFR